MRLRSWLTNLYFRLPRSDFRTNPRRPMREMSAPTAIEQLESRQLLSVEPVAFGPEVRVDSAATGTADGSPVVATDASGDYVVVWLKYDGPLESTILAHRYTAAGVSEGSTITTVVTGTAEPRNPAVAMDATGAFVIAWENDDLNLIQAQRYNSSGVVQGSEFTVSPSSVGDIFAPSIVMDSVGNFAIAWDQGDQAAQEFMSVPYSLYAQRYNANGTAQGARFKINTSTASTNPSPPEVAMDAAGNFVIAWTDDNTSDDIFAQRYNAAGVAQGAAITVDRATTVFVISVAVAIDQAGDFVISWEARTSMGGSSIYDQRYNSAGIAQGGALQIADGDSPPRVAMDAAGDFLVTWAGYDEGIVNQRYNAAGIAQGGEFFINPTTSISEILPMVAMDAVGNFVITWLGNLSTNSYGVGSGVYAQSYQVAAAAINHSPVGTANTVMTPENMAYTFKIADFGFTDPSDTPPNTFLAVKITTLPLLGKLTDKGVAVAAGAHVSVTDITAGNLKFTPALNGKGAAYASFTFQVQDDGGTANGGVDTDSTPRTMTLTVNSINHAPVGAAKTVTTLEDTAYAFKVADFVFTDPQDTPPNALLAVKITTLPLLGSLTDNGVAVSAGAFVPATDIMAGNLKFAPATNKNGAAYASFTFQVQDNGGIANGGIDTDATPRKMTLSVTSVNDPPVGMAKTVTTLEDTPYAFKAADFGFTDPSDSPPNTLLAVRIATLPLLGSLKDNGISVAVGAHITVADITAGKLKFTPAANANGATYASFTFQVQDNGGTANGGVDTDPTPRTMTLSVTSVNDAPVGMAKTVTTLEDTAYVFNFADFGFADPNDVPANGFLAVKIATLPLLGKLTDNGVMVAAGTHVTVTDITAGKLKFTPATNGNGATYASFTFQVQDNGGTANAGVDTDLTPRKMTLSVTPVNDAPVGTAKTVTTAKNTAYAFKVTDFGFTDPNDVPANTLLAVKITTLPLLGQLTDNGVAVVAGTNVLATDIAGGKLKFTPALNGIGTAYTSFTFQVQDNGGTANGGVDTDTTARKLTISVT